MDCNAAAAHATLTNTKGWTIDGDALQCTVTAIKQEENTVNVTCYPNPYSKEWNETFTIKGMTGETLLVLMSDVNGKIIYNGTLDNNAEVCTLPVNVFSALSAGTYVLLVSSGDVAAHQLVLIR
jgi:hypothetical protein